MPRVRVRKDYFVSRASRLRYCSPSTTYKEIKEWEEARCPICMDPPHNGILLICSSYGHSCRPYMCNTDSRLSNCYNQFRGTSKQTGVETGEGSVPVVIPSGSVVIDLTGEGSSVVTADEVSNEGDISKLKLKCPLCRGEVLKCTNVGPARRFMNAKTRSCSSETCEFSGTYNELRKHARDQHPDVKPSVADPERVHNWRVMQQDRDLQDLLNLQEYDDSVFDEDDDEYVPTNEDVMMSFGGHVQNGAPSINLETRQDPPEELTRNQVVQGSGIIRVDVRNGQLTRRQTVQHESMFGDDHNQMSGTWSGTQQHMVYTPASRVTETRMPTLSRDGGYNMHLGNTPVTLRPPQMMHYGNDSILRFPGGSSLMGTYGARPEYRPEASYEQMSSIPVNEDLRSRYFLEADRSYFPVNLPGTVRVPQIYMPFGNYAESEEEEEETREV